MQSRPDDHEPVGTPQLQPAIKAGQWAVFFIIIAFFILVGLLWLIAAFPLGIVAILAVVVAVPATTLGFFQLEYFKVPGERTLEIIGNWIDARLTLLSNRRNSFPFHKQTFSQNKQSSSQKSSFIRIPIHIQIDWKLAWATTSTLVVIVLLTVLVPTVPHIPIFCGNIFDGPTISYPSPTQEPVGISGDKSCFDFEKQNGDNDDIEQLIYTENRQAVPDTSKPHITLVVAVSLTGTDSSSVAVGKVVLRGALIAQKEYNQKATSNRRLRLLVANDGSNAQYAKILANDIVNLAKNDSTILGVVGWPFSTFSTQDALATLDRAQISSISPTLSSNDFTGSFSYFFRIAPPDLEQGVYGANFAKKQWKPQKVVIFVDHGNPYSRSLATSFAAALEGSASAVFFVEYIRNEADTVVPGLVQKALSFQPNLIYFAGYANDFDPIRGNLWSRSHTVHVMGGDGLYELGGYQNNNSNFQSIYFTAFATTYQSKQGPAEPQPFSTNYGNTFNALQLYPNAVDSSIGESDSILAYDATNTFLEAYSRSNSLSREANHQALHVMNDDDKGKKGAIQGASGRVSFGLDGNPEEKVVFVLHADGNHNVCIVAVYGKYSEGSTSQPDPQPDCP